MNIKFNKEVKVHLLLPRSMLKLALMKKELKIYMKVTKLKTRRSECVKCETVDISVDALYCPHLPFC